MKKTLIKFYIFFLGFSTTTIIICLGFLLLPIPPSLKASAAEENCSKIQTEAEKNSCWNNVIESTLAQKGLDQTFDLINALYTSDPGFAQECHGYTHILGDKTYLLYSIHKNPTLSSKTSYCGYGFYHGFMERLLTTTGDYQQARDFCTYAGATLKEQTSDAEGACLHGIGHGAVEDIPDKKLWGNPQGIINPSLAICEKISKNEMDVFRCTSGVYNALEIVTSESKYGLVYNNADPFEICHSQKEAYKKACYSQFIIGAMHITQNDLLKTAAFIQKIPNTEYAQNTLLSMALEFVRLGQTDYNSTLSFCRNLSKDFVIPCIEGVAEGFLKYGPPQQEYKRALDFCGSSLLTATETTSCYAHILPLLRIWYTKEKSEMVCKSVETQYWFNNCVYR